MISVLIFLIALAVYYTIGKQYQSMILMLLSLYVYWEVASWNILIIASISGIVAVCATCSVRHYRKWVVIIPICALIAGFVLLRWNWAGIALPLGYSVLSFTSISLLVDQYKDPYKYRLIDVVSYLLFFPKIFAGPIERARDFIPSSTKTFHVVEIYSGFKYLVFAAFCKFIIGDLFASTDMSASGINLWMQIFVYAIGFFFDFWAYTLMAIGVGRIFGYYLSISFYRPYFSTSLCEFWHRWNITLGTWFRDYIYIPLGGKYLSIPAWSGAILLVFIFSGLWHGATWPFLIWGLLHGCMLIAERILIKPDRLTSVFKIMYSVAVFFLVCLLWQLFIIDNLDEIMSLGQSLFMGEPINTKIIIQLAGCTLSYIILTSDKVFSLVEQSYESRTSVIAEVTMISVMVVVLVVMNCPWSFNFFYFRF